MPIAHLTRRARFSAAHRYYRPEWTEQRNRDVFGACSNPHGHGHNYELEATVVGEVDATTGFCIDLGALDAILKREVVDVLDHRHINHAVPEFREGGLVPSSENLLLWLWPRLADALPAGVRLERLRLSEDADLSVELRGEELT